MWICKGFATSKPLCTLEELQKAVRLAPPSAHPELLELLPVAMRFLLLVRCTWKTRSRRC